MTPKIVKIEGVKTPPKVPRPAELASITLEDDSGERDVIDRKALDHLNLAGNGTGMPPNFKVVRTVSKCSAGYPKKLKNQGLCRLTQ